MMRSKLLFISSIFGLLAFLLPGVVFLQSVNAQSNGIRLTTSPLPINLATDPGKRVTAELRIKNSGSQPETLKMGLLKFTANSDDGTPILLEREPGDDYFDWVTFSDEEFTLAPNEWKTLQMHIDVPEDAAFGYYYAATFTRATPDAEGQAVVVGSTATLVLLEVAHEGAYRDIFIESFKTDKPWYEFLPVGFQITLRNDGNIHGAAHGNIFISKGGQTVGTLDVNMAKGNILPNSNRSFASEWADGFPVYVDENDGEIKVDASGQRVQKLDWNVNNAGSFRFGKFTAHLVMAYDDGQRDIPIESSIDFWIIPWRLILIAIAIPVLPALLVFIIMRIRQKKSRNEPLYNLPDIF